MEDILYGQQMALQALTPGAARMELQAEHPSDQIVLTNNVDLQVWSNLNTMINI